MTQAGSGVRRAQLRPAAEDRREEPTRVRQPQGAGGTSVGQREAAGCPRAARDPAEVSAHRAARVREKRLQFTRSSPRHSADV